jgi:hypothetical protein
MDIDEIKKAFDLICQVENKGRLLVRDVARALRVPSLDLMEFINANPKLFHIEPLYSYKDVKKRHTIAGRHQTFTTTESVRNKLLGTAIHQVYLTAADNWRTDEWLGRMVRENEKYIHITESDNYGYIQGYYVETDQPDDYRRHIWRNSPEKVKKLKDAGYLMAGSFVYGGFGDSYTSKYDHVITISALNELKSRGWKTNDFKPLS